MEPENWIPRWAKLPLGWGAQDASNFDQLSKDTMSYMGFQAAQLPQASTAQGVPLRKHLASAACALAVPVFFLGLLESINTSITWYSSRLGGQLKEPRQLLGLSLLQPECSASTGFCTFGTLQKPMLPTVEGLKGNRPAMHLGTL